MSSKSAGRTKSKVKVGTILDKEIYQLLRERATRENRTIGGLIEEAVAKFEREEQFARDVRLHACDQLFSVRFTLPDEDWRIILEDEFYDQ